MRFFLICVMTWRDNVVYSELGVSLFAHTFPRRCKAGNYGSGVLCFCDLGCNIG